MPTAVSLFREPLHPYTNALLSAVPSADPVLRDRASRIRLVGDPPSPIDPPPGCRFASRCPFAEDRCRAEEPALRTIGGGGGAGHRVRCHLVSDDGVPPHRGLRIDRAFGVARRPAASQGARRFPSGGGAGDEAGDQGGEHRPALPGAHREERERGDGEPQRRDDGE